ncbi:MAG TPA: DoxX family protein [Ktedonobacteraceae bacterium]|nr:DoxX family protein [Ktedonobacteraceae bacterium]
MRRTGIRLLLSGIFIYGGWGAFSKPGGRPKLVAAAGIPRPEQAVVLNGALMILAGLLLSLGIMPKLAAALLIGSLVPTTLVGHPFWKEESGPEREKQMLQFLKNLGLISGLLMVLTEKNELKA